MNKTALEIAARIMGEVSEHYSNHSCNDFELHNSPWNHHFVVEMNSWLKYNDDPPMTSQDGKTLLLTDWMVMDYLKHLLEQEAEKWIR